MSVKKSTKFQHPVVHTSYNTPYLAKEKVAILKSFKASKLSAREYERRSAIPRSTLGRWLREE